jgi:cell division protein FtsW
MEGIRGTPQRVGRKRKEQAEYFFDYTLLFIVLFLLGFGLVMIYSTSSYEAYQDFDDATHYLTRQATSIVVGILGMIVVANIPYHFWERFAGLGYIVSAALLILIIPFGVESHNAKRWLPMFGGFNIQPAEVTKLCMIIFLASLACKLGKNIRALAGFIIMVVAPMPLAIMIWQITDNLSSAIIVVGISILMVFVASPDYKKFIIMGVIGVAGAALGVFLIVSAASTEGMGFRSERIAVWLNPEADAQGVGFQTMQALYAIGSGGIWGKGLGESMQKLGFLPEAQNDMIFSIICEELGLFGAVSIILMFILLLWRMMIIANNAPDLFGGLLVVGVIGHIAIQVILNISVVTNTIPNTGISLPFISYGGSSILFLLIEIGLVLSVAKRIQLKEV